MRETGFEKKKKRAAYAAALWSLSFALLHIAWAAGWYPGLPAQEARLAFQKTWFLIYDLIAAALCVVAVIVAVKFAVPKKNSPPQFLKVLAWCGTIVLALRGAAGIIKIIYLAIAGKSVFEWTFLWEIWFCLGAGLFWLAIRQFGNAEDNDDGFELKTKVSSAKNE